MTPLDSVQSAETTNTSTFVDSGSQQVVIGGVIGGVMVLVAVAIVVLVIFVVVKCRSKRGYGFEEFSGVVMENAIYDGGMRESDTDL